MCVPIWEKRFQMQLANGSYVKAHARLVGAKVAVARYARLYGYLGYRAVDTRTGETWAWDPGAGKLVQVESPERCSATDVRPIDPVRP